MALKIHAIKLGKCIAQLPSWSTTSSFVSFHSEGSPKLPKRIIKGQSLTALHMSLVDELKHAVT
jgi:hypothetical protein